MIPTKQWPNDEDSQAYVMRKTISEMWNLLTDEQKAKMRRSQREAAKRIADGEEAPTWLDTWQSPDGLAEFEKVLHAINACRLSGEKARYVFDVEYHVSIPEATGRDEVFWTVRLRNADSETVASLKELFKNDMGVQNRVIAASEDYSLLNVEPADFWR